MSCHGGNNGLSRCSWWHCHPVTGFSHGVYKWPFQHTFCRPGQLWSPIGNLPWEMLWNDDWSACIHAFKWQQRGYMRPATITYNRGKNGKSPDKYLNTVEMHTCDLFILVIYTLQPSCIARVVTPQIPVLALHCPVSPSYIWTINLYYDDDNLFSNEHRNDIEHLVVLLAVYSVWQACVNHKTTWIQLHILWQVKHITFFQYPEFRFKVFSTLQPSWEQHLACFILVTCSPSHSVFKIKLQHKL